jgi:hypothetical protein
MEMERIGKFGHGVSYAFRWFLRLFWLGLFGTAIWASMQPPAPPHIATEQELRQTAIIAAVREREQQKLETEKYLCRKAAGCRTYDKVRLECATAGNFKTCLRIKMGDDAQYAELCSGYDVGSSALPLDPQTPDMVRCFFLNNFSK